MLCLEIFEIPSFRTMHSHVGGAVEVNDTVRSDFVLVCHAHPTSQDTKNLQGGDAANVESRSVHKVDPDTGLVDGKYSATSSVQDFKEWPTWTGSSTQCEIKILLLLPMTPTSAIQMSPCVVGRSLAGKGGG